MSHGRGALERQVTTSEVGGRDGTITESAGGNKGGYPPVSRGKPKKRQREWGGLKERE